MSQTANRFFRLTLQIPCIIWLISSFSSSSATGESSAALGVIEAPRNVDSRKDFTEKSSRADFDHITIWAAKPIKDVIVTRPVFAGVEEIGGLIRLDNAEKRLCTSSNASSSVPPCPVGLEKRPSQENPLMILVRNDVSYNTLSSRDTIVTYSNGTHTVRVTFQVDYCETYPLSSVCHHDRQCPEQQGDIVYYIDITDDLCKPLNVTTRRPLVSWSGPCNCETTCFTPQAIQGTWPFINETMRQSFTSDRFVTTRPFGLKKERLQRRIDTHYGSACSALKTKTHNESLIPDYLHFSIGPYLILLPEARLMFCGIPKVGMSEWLKFFRYTLGARDYLSDPHFKTDLREFHLSRLSNAQIADILTDPTWTKAVFFRDPAERLLSAYLDKIKREHYTRIAFGIGKETDEPEYVLNFTDFVRLVTHRDEQHPSNGLHWKTDAHWAPQLLTGGLDQTFPFFDFVGNFQHVGLHSKLLLEKVGLWDQWGSTFESSPGHGGHGRHSCAQPPPNSSSSAHTLGFNQNDPSDKAYQHSTGSQSMLERYYTPELLADVRQAYGLDYAVWDEIKDRDPTDVAAAYNLNHVKKLCEGTRHQP